MTALTWRYHTLIQALLSRGPLKEEEFHEVFIGISGGKDPVKNENIFNEALRKINDALSYVQFELRACRNQYDGKVYYGVVNNIADEQSKLGTKYSAPQIAFYKGVIEAIVNDTGPEGTISNIDALNVRLENQIVMSQASPEGAKLPTAFRLFNISQKEKTLQELIKDRWLCQSSSDQIGLGIRSFFDLRGWFRTNEVPSCDVCNEAGVKASVCPKEGCTVRIHYYCLRKKFSNKVGSRSCPSCGTEWPLSEYESEEIHENNTTSPDESQIASASNVPVPRKRRSTKVKCEDSGQDLSQSQRKRHRVCKPEPVEREEPSRRVRTRSQRA